MSNAINMNKKKKEPKLLNGMAVLIFNSLLVIAAIFIMIIGIIILSNRSANAAGVLMVVIGGIYGVLIGWIPYLGLKIVKPNEAYVFTLFGKYYGTIKREGFFMVNPFVTAVNPSAGTPGATSAAYEQTQTVAIKGLEIGTQLLVNKKVSLKVTTLNNDKQKINDQLGNPIIIGIVVVWKIVNPTKAVFNVDNYKEFLSIQCDAALRNIVRLYPYDIYGDDNEKTLRGSSQEISLKLSEEIQEKVEIAGIDVIEARITNLSYAPEIAAAMLQRQQASAIIDARQMIAEGAVGMVELALLKLSAKDIVSLDDERKAAMVSNLMVVLCGNKDATPVINSGTLY
jgi:regulator of protease activity HflC (stomatin/prohibitin superfamily)